MICAVPAAEKRVKQTTFMTAAFLFPYKLEGETFNNLFLTKATIAYFCLKKIEFDAVGIHFDFEKVGFLEKEP